MYFMTPTFRPVGGVVKIFDYVNHALTLGYEPIISCPESYKPGLPLFEIPRFSAISPENGIPFTDLEKVAVGPHDLAFLSWPTHYEIVEPRLSRWTCRTFAGPTRSLRTGTPSASSRAPWPAS